MLGVPPSTLSTYLGRDARPRGCPADPQPGRRPIRPGGADRPRPGRRPTRQPAVLAVRISRSTRAWIDRPRRSAPSWSRWAKRSSARRTPWRRKPRIEDRPAIQIVRARSILRRHASLGGCHAPGSSPSRRRSSALLALLVARLRRRAPAVESRPRPATAIPSVASATPASSEPSARAARPDGPAVRISRSSSTARDRPSEPVPRRGRDAFIARVAAIEDPRRHA